MYGSAISVFIALCLLLQIGYSADESRYTTWQKEADGLWSVEVRDGGLLRIIYEEGKLLRYQAEKQCPSDSVGSTVDVIEWQEGDRSSVHSDCLGSTDLPPVLEMVPQLPSEVIALLKKDRREPTKDGTLLYAAGQ